MLFSVFLEFKMNFFSLMVILTNIFIISYSISIVLDVSALKSFITLVLFCIYLAIAL